MKNIIKINESGEVLVSSVNDDANTLWINDSLIDSGQWIGSGNYTDTIESHNITIEKVSDGSGNIQLIRISEYNYKLVKLRSFSSVIDVYEDGSSVVDEAGIAHVSRGSTFEWDLDLVYPIGSIYMSVNDTDPALLFGGAWERLTDRFLVGAGNIYENEEKGGSATVRLTGSESGIQEHSISFIDDTVDTVSDEQGFINGGSVRYDYVKSADAEYNTKTVTVHSKNAVSPHNNLPPYLAVYMWKRVPVLLVDSDGNNFVDSDGNYIEAKER